MTVFGYIRKNFPIETSSQINQLMSFGCQDLFIEKPSLMIDTELQLLLNSMHSGDKLVVTSILAFGKSVNDLQKIVHKLVSKEIHLVCLKENIDTLKFYSFNEVLNILASINKETTGEKVKQRLVELQSSGKKLGRPTIEEETIVNIQYLRHEKKMTLREIAEKCGVSLGTVYKYI